MDKIEIVEVDIEQKSILRQLIELYEYDFSEFNDSDVNEQGYYGYTYFDHYWTDENRFPYFIKFNEQYAGFVLVNSFCYLYENEPARSIAEFFVMRKYRRRGIGKAVARKIFDKHRGNWEVLQHENNTASYQFWKEVISCYTEGVYKEQPVMTKAWNGTGLLFNNTR